MKRFLLGPLQLDAGQRVLYRDGEIVPLPPKAFDILLLLAENAGQVVSRETIRQQVWKDSIVEDANITNNISQLRSVLSEHLGSDPIRTLSKRGYQFIAPVSPTSSGGAAAVHAGTDVNALDTIRAVNRWKMRTALASALVLLVAVGAWAYIYHREHRFEALNITSSRTAITSGLNMDADPAVSPDGSQLAYVTGKAGQHFRLALQPFHQRNEPERMIDTGPGEAMHPAWSPDGKQIAFQHCISGPCEIDILNLSDGKVRRVASPGVSFFNDAQFYLLQSRRAIWSTDGKALLFPARTASGDSAIIRHDLSTNAEQPLIAEHQGIFSDLALSPDGRMLAFMHGADTHSELQTLDLKTMLRSTVISPWPQATNGVTWWPDGRSVLVSSNSYDGHGFELWRISLRGETARVTVPVTLPMLPQFTPDGKTLMLLSVNQDQDFVALDDRNPERATLTMAHALGNNTMADPSPDGHKLAVLQYVRSTRGYELFIAKLDEGAIGDLQPLTHGLAAAHSHSVQWSPDGRWVVIGQSEAGRGVLIVDALNGQFSTLKTPGLESYNMPEPVWSADSQSLYVPASGPKRGIYVVSAGPVPGARLLLACDPTDLRADGDRALYFEQRRVDGIYRVALHGEPKAELVPQLADIRPSNNWTIVNGGLYFIDIKDPNYRLQRLDLKSGALAVVVPSVPRPVFNRGWLTYMPDQHQLLYSQWAENGVSQIVGFSLQ